MGPATNLPKNDLTDLLHDEEDKNSINIQKNQSCQYFEPEDIHEIFNNNCFSLYSHNVRSLSGHFDDLRDSLYLMLPASFTVIALQELWSIKKSYDLTGYSELVYRTRDMNTDSNPNCGGGVGFYVSNSFEFQILEEESVFLSGIYESLWIKVKTDKNTFKIIGNVYRPNSAPTANIKQAIKVHSSILSKLKSNPKHSKCAIEVVGDFNIDLLKFQIHEDTNDYLESLLSFGLLPVITKPTRISQNSATLIDHISVNNKSNIHVAGIILSYISDHFPTFYIDQTKAPKQKLQPYKTFKMNKETEKCFDQLLKSTSFQGVITENDPHLAFSNFLELYNTSASLAFPEITVSPRKSDFSHSPWMTPGLLTSCKTKQKLLRAKQAKPTEKNISDFRTFNSIFTACRRKAQSNYYFEQFTDCKNNLKETWKLVRDVSCSKKRQKDSLPEYFRYKNDILRSPQEIASNFNKYFTEIGPDLAQKIPSSRKHFSDFLGAPNTEDFQFSEMSELRIMNFVKKNETNMLLWGRFSV